MLSIILFFVATLWGNCSFADSATEFYFDRVKGALISSAFGDAFGMVTEKYGTKSEIFKAYGEKGITSLYQIVPCDWIYDPYSHKEAPYTTNTVFALLMYTTSLEGREYGLSVQDMTEGAAQAIVNLFGPQKYFFDNHFNFRKHPENCIKAAERLSFCLEHKKGFFASNEIMDCERTLENESSALARAWPIGLVFADDPEKAKIFVASQATLTHAHPKVLFSSIALARGMAAAIQGEPINTIVTEMIKEAEKAENSRLESDLEKADTRSVSDLLRYAYAEGKLSHGYLEQLPQGKHYGERADEALAAVIALLVKHESAPQNALFEAVNNGGKSALIASLVGAFIGAIDGYEHCAKVIGSQLDLLENIRQISEDAQQLPLILMHENGHASQHFTSSNLFSRYLVYGCLAGLGAYSIYRLLS